MLYHGKKDTNVNKNGRLAINNLLGLVFFSNFAMIVTVPL